MSHAQRQPVDSRGGAEGDGAGGGRTMRPVVAAGGRPVRSTLGHAGRGVLALGVRGSWRVLAACRGMPYELFFPPDEPEPAAQWVPEPAQAVCATCPVRALCRREALANREREGVWGGLRPEELRRRRRARSGRPAARPVQA